MVEGFPGSLAIKSASERHAIGLSNCEDKERCDQIDNSVAYLWGMYKSGGYVIYY
jgi:hypothetical protein